MYTVLKRILNEFEEMPSQDWKIFQSILVISTIKKNEFLLNEGQVCKGIYFITSGAVRTYLSSGGKEINTSFCFENDFVSDFESLTKEIPSKKSIQAMEDAAVIFFPKSKLLPLYKQSHSFQTLGRKILEQVVISEQQYSSLFTIYSPEERYSYILKNYPKLIQRVPLQFLASYLGVARETLSRIRKRLS